MRFLYSASLALALISPVVGHASEQLVILPGATGSTGTVYAAASNESTSPYLSGISGPEYIAQSLNTNGSPVGSASASELVDAAEPLVSASASATEATPPKGQLYTADAEATDSFLQYSFEVVSPVTTTVGLLIEARGGTYVSPGNSAGGAIAQLQIGLATYSPDAPPLSIFDELWLGETEGNAVVTGSAGGWLYRDYYRGSCCNR
jgi:hypothetical protein